MEKIQKLYEEVKDFKELYKIYNQNKKEIDILANEIEQLKNERKSIDLISLKRKIKSLEEEYHQTFKEIDCFTMLSSVCITVDDLENVFKNIEDDSQCYEKCIGFLKNLIVSYNLSKSSLSKYFNVKNAEDYNRVIKVTKDVEVLLNLSKSRSFYKNIEHELLKMIKEEFRGTVISEIELFTSEVNFFFIFALRNDEKDDEIVCENADSTTFNSEYKKYPLFFNHIFQVLKECLSIRLIDDQLSPVDVLESNKHFQDSQFHIKNTDEWILDVIVKRIAEIIKSERIFENIVEIHDGISGNFISGQYNVLKKCITLLKDVNSERKEKAYAIIKKSMIRFFNLSSSVTLMETFVFYSDITHFLKSFQVFKNDALDRIRENSFYQIIEISTSLRLDLNQPCLVLKAKLKQQHYDFTEYIHQFISKNAWLLFHLQFFESLYSNYINFILQPKKYNDSEIKNLNELSKYILELSYEFDKERIQNYNKIQNICQILNSSIRTITEEYEQGRIYLSKEEFKIALRVLVSESFLRDKLLNELS